MLAVPVEELPGAVALDDALAAAAAQDLFALVVLLLDERVRDPELAARVVAEADDVARPDVVAVDVLLGLRVLQ